MAQLTKWQSPHIRLSTLEAALGHRLDTFRSYKTDDMEEVIAIRVHRDRWNWYGIDVAMEKLGLNDLSVIYINL
jgi:hypothetical protein